ncbi:hypothetical protein THUN1379_28470 [Paludibacterium sp. THUN1379]|nr:hypothetical protein THUN1379_28470 [Paludibacterium sp. THUN1379]
MAVIMALLLVALAASAASLVLWQQGLWWQQVEVDRQRAQMRLLLDAQLAWAATRLHSRAIVALNQSWARPWQGSEGDYHWQARLHDLQSRLNLNALGLPDGRVNQDMLEAYQRLLQSLQLPGTLADQLVRWQGLRPADGQGGSGQAVRGLRDWRQLAEVSGYTPAVMQRLGPLVSLLPSSFSRINLNTAPLPLLQALLPEVAPAALARVLQQRRTLPFRDQADFASRVGAAAVLRPSLFATSSVLFQLHGVVRHQRAERHVEAILQVEAGRVRLLRRAEPGALPPLAE